MRYVLIAAVLIAALFLNASCYDTVGRDAARDMRDSGYTDVQLEPSVFAWCAKGRYGFRFDAKRNGRAVTGHVCAGGFVGASVREDRRRG